jgi:PAP2 superfamily
LSIDRDLHAGWVATMTGWVAHHDLLSDLLAGYYVVMHLGVVALTLVILWINGDRYRWHRDALLLLSAVSFLVFWFYPVAPPRLINAGFPDTVRHVLPFAYRTEAAAANLYAAVPSLHVAWALWVTITLFTISRRWWVRTLAVGHTVLTTATVLGTGNHYLFDVITGAAATVASYLLLPVVLGIGRAISPPRSLPVAAEPATIDLVGAQVEDRERRGADRR